MEEKIEVVGSLSKLIGAKVLIRLAKNEIKPSKVNRLCLKNGWLIFNSNGTLRGRSFILKKDCEIWKPETENFPKLKCAVFFPVLIFEEKADYTFDEYSCRFSFEDPEAETLIAKIIDKLLHKAEASMME